MTRDVGLGATVTVCLKDRTWKGTQVEEQQSKSRACRVPLTSWGGGQGLLFTWPRTSVEHEAASPTSMHETTLGPCFFCFDLALAGSQLTLISHLCMALHMPFLGLGSSQTLTCIHYTNRTHPWPLLFYWTCWPSHPVSFKESSYRLGETTKGSMWKNLRLSFYTH